MTPSLSADIDPQTIVCQGMLLSKRIKKQFTRVQETDGGKTGRGERIAKVRVRVFARETKKNNLMFEKKRCVSDYPLAWLSTRDPDHCLVPFLRRKLIWSKLMV